MPKLNLKFSDNTTLAASTIPDGPPIRPAVSLSTGDDSAALPRGTEQSVPMDQSPAAPQEEGTGNVDHLFVCTLTMELVDSQ